MIDVNILRENPETLAAALKRRGAQLSVDELTALDRRRREVPARPHEVHSIVLWSKNFGPFLDRKIGEKLERRGYRLFFNFTINAADRKLEPYVPPLAERIRQITELAQRHDPQAITWRFDPICFFRHSDSVTLHLHLDALEPIADALAAVGIRRCVTSFVDLYPKLRKRLRGTDLALVDPPLDIKVETLTAMAAALRKRQIVLHLCCEQAILDALPVDIGIRSGACIPGPLLAALFGVVARVVSGAVECPVAVVVGERKTLVRAHGGEADDVGEHDRAECGLVDWAIADRGGAEAAQEDFDLGGIDRDHLVRNVAVRRRVDLDHGVCVGSLDQAEGRLAVVVEPIGQIAGAVAFL